MIFPMIRKSIPFWLGQLLHKSSKNSKKLLQNRAGRNVFGEDARPQYKCEDENGNRCGTFLNTDFEVFYNMDLDEDDFLSVCDVSAAAAECPKSDTYDLAVKYASVSENYQYLGLLNDVINPIFQDNALWLADYSAAYDVMTAKTVSTLKEID